LRRSLLNVNDCRLWLLRGLQQLYEWLAVDGLLPSLRAVKSPN
jgi:hypothetical protein